MTKKEFLVVYNENLPCKYTKFVYRLNGVIVDGKEGLKKYIMPIIVLLFLIGFFSTMLSEWGANLPEGIAKYSTIAFTVIIFPVVVSIFIGIYLNMRRIKRIMKKLNIEDTKEYNQYTAKYLN